MNLFNKVVLSKDDFYEVKKQERDEAWESAKQYWENEFKNRIENLEKENKRLKKQASTLVEDHEEEIAEIDKRNDRDVKKLEKEIDRLNDVNAVLEEAQDEAREVVKAQIANADKENMLDAVKERLDVREASFKDREAKLESKEEGRYKAGYADGVADGVRKISEITQKDRDNAMKIAMVAASSHTPVQNMKEVMNVNRQLTAGTEDSETQES